MAEWLRDTYLELIQKSPLDFEGLRPAVPYSNPLEANWESDAKKWEASSRNWETLARLFYLQTKVEASIKSLAGNKYSCYKCDMDFGGSYPDACLCKCRLLRLVDETFREELESLRENPGQVEQRLPRTSKLSMSYLCLFENNFA